MLNKNRCWEQERLIKALQLIANIQLLHAQNCTKKDWNCRLNMSYWRQKKIKRMLLKSWGIVYEHGEKAGWLLAHQLKSRLSQQHISCIMKANGEVTVDPVEINDTFQAFYAKLYSSEAPKDNIVMDIFFNNLKMPRINAVSRAELELDLMHTEIADSIRSMQNGKAPGPDGYPI